MLKDMTDWPLCRRVPQNFGTKNGTQRHRAPPVCFFSHLLKNKKGAQHPLIFLISGGEGGIRTHGTAHHSPLDFESSALVHSATSPQPPKEFGHKLSALVFQYPFYHFYPVIKPGEIENVY